MPPTDDTINQIIALVCALCGIPSHSTEDHRCVICERAGPGGAHSAVECFQRCLVCPGFHRTSEHQCLLCGSPQHCWAACLSRCLLCGNPHRTEDHMCELCGRVGHSFRACPQRCVRCAEPHRAADHVCEICRRPAIECDLCCVLAYWREGGWGRGPPAPVDDVALWV